MDLKSMVLLYDKAGRKNTTMHACSEMGPKLVGRNQSRCSTLQADQMVGLHTSSNFGEPLVWDCSMGRGNHGTPNLPLKARKFGIAACSNLSRFATLAMRHASGLLAEVRPIASNIEPKVSGMQRLPRIQKTRGKESSTDANRIAGRWPCACEVVRTR